MKKVEWPERTCRQTIWKGDTAYSCDVVENHPGPCASFSMKDGVETREKWEAANPGWESTMKQDGGVFE